MGISHLNDGELALYLDQVRGAKAINHDGKTEHDPGYTGNKYDCVYHQNYTYKKYHYGE